MSVSDNDIELLDSWLDGAISFSEASPLRQRLAEESDLAAAMQDLRGERALRQAAFASLLPDEDDTGLPERLLSGVRIAAARSQTRRRMLGFAAMAAAACLLLGFGAGRAMLHGPSVAVNPNPAPHQAVVHGPQVETVVTYQVSLTDESGHVTAVQSFDSLEHARAFAADVGSWQQRRELLHDNAAVVVADRF
jgi:anti-sigma factor RsiW